MFTAKPNYRRNRLAAGNAEKLVDRVARIALERTLRKALRPGIVEARKVAKGIAHLGNTKGLRAAVKSYKQSRLVLAYVGWDAKVPVSWMGRMYKSSRHGERIEYGGEVTRAGKKKRTPPYSVLRRSFAAKREEMQRVFQAEHVRMMRAEAAKLNK